MQVDRPNVNRREFLKKTGSVAGIYVAESVGLAKSQAISIIVDPDDPVASAAPSRWAVEQLLNTLHGRGISAEVHEHLSQAAPADFCIISSGLGSAVSREVRKSASANIADAAESLGLIPGKASGRPVLLACGRDIRGLVYALLELADRSENATDPVAALQLRSPVIESPANPVRSVARFFVSDVEDNGWYNDRAMWPQYLTMLAMQRFNRFALTLGIGYDFTRQVRDCYFHFAYPFLVAVPGYNVQVSGVSNEERDRNLEMLKYISKETAARGLEFQLGIWTHAYQWTDSPNANHTITGLTAQNHAAYCRDALQKLLDACPAISGVTFRIHGESGVPEQSYAFWKTVFQGITRTNRRIEIDMHAKGMDQQMIEVAVSTGLPVKVSPKYWAEHMGLPYHQTSIRDLEMPKENKDAFFALSSGSRSFLRYGYGDLLKEDRNYGVLHRTWPGTQRLLLWGDPVMAAAYSRASTFCGSSGVELCEPLSFKGRKGSGLPHGRCAYADKSLEPKWDWQKYLYTYRVWGRLLYNPDAEPDSWQRYLKNQFHSAAQPVQAALAHSSRVLPLVTTAHGPSAANNNYWPEMYTNMPIVDPARKHPYSDTPSPKRFGAVSPFDPGLFSSVDNFARELLQGERTAKYSPIEVATWLEELANASEQNLTVAAAKIGRNPPPEFRRLAVDVAIQNGLGRFFAGKLRAGVLFAIFEQTRDQLALQEALRSYKNARGAWQDLANRAKGVYVDDVTFGCDQHLRGHWLDRLPAIDQDIADMQSRAVGIAVGIGNPEWARSAAHEALSSAHRPRINCTHTPAKNFRAGEPLDIQVAVPDPARANALLHYRHTNQAETWQVQKMQTKDGRFGATIPGEYTKSPYPLEYYFEIRTEAGTPSLYPGLAPDLSNQPYFVVRRA